MKNDTEKFSTEAKQSFAPLLIQFKHSIKKMRNKKSLGPSRYANTHIIRSYDAI